jgi:hypothetical protein
MKKKAISSAIAHLHKAESASPKVAANEMLKVIDILEKAIKKISADGGSDDHP